ncbi:hypothetical protein FD724_39245 (plasmid) [Nostoc sp. C057]|nr:hypothetical protein FD724_39245 [Nostoc sp. C057]
MLIFADFTIGQESRGVAASRARHELKIYTEDLNAIGRVGATVESQRECFGIAMKTNSEIDD